MLGVTPPGDALAPPPFPESAGGGPRGTGRGAVVRRPLAARRSNITPPRPGEGTVRMRAEPAGGAEPVPAPAGAGAGGCVGPRFGVCQERLYL